MPSGQNNMDNKFEDQVLTMEALNEKIASEFTDMKYDTKKRYYGSTKMRYDMNNIKTMLTNMLIRKLYSFPEKMDSPKAQDPSNLVLPNNKYLTLEGVNSTKNVGIWTLKHGIITPKFYKLLINT